MATAEPKRKICVVTGTRAEYGLLFWLMKELLADERVELQVIATCAHLSPEFGRTITRIEEDGFAVAEKIEMLLSSDTGVGTVKSTGLALIGLADAFARLRPDIVVVLGDRFETLATALASLLLKIPLVHLCGGEVTAGAFDDAIRHSITKMAALHFVTHSVYARRVAQLGEEAHRIHDVGPISAENVWRLNLKTRSQLAPEIGFSESGLLFLVTYHPATLEGDPVQKINALTVALTAALDQCLQSSVLITMPNADPDSRIIREKLLVFAASHVGRVHAVDSLGQLNYLSVMSFCDVVVGNSSSGLLEAPVLGKPTVNIGGRQDGRLKPRSVLDCADDADAIAGALAQALSPTFVSQCVTDALTAGTDFPSRRMAHLLADVRLDGLVRKRFVDFN